MTYAQITLEERYALALLLRQGHSRAAIARYPSTVGREVGRNATRYDNSYRCQLADHYANGRRTRTRRNAQFTADEWATVESVLREDWSPEQIVGWFARFRIREVLAVRPSDEDATRMLKQLAVPQN